MTIPIWEALQARLQPTPEGIVEEIALLHFAHSQAERDDEYIRILQEETALSNSNDNLIKGGVPAMNTPSYP